ncbi:zinc finger domain protein, LSD1 subclass [Anaeroglobus geminatus F0357]|uniref:Zinc finger domain protein, LSD1 subclass n=1 Tax=Anaeroglobus geminatus F0357 TaxID=861450 RepID=G9YGJ3_9FIRM|nr:zinc finger domain protein, LSD1 subclass [Anaeroglobus geminatus F0357]
MSTMRDELARGNYNILSAKLCDLLRETLRQKKQAIVLLNRRGFSTFVMCRKCGYVVKCDTCDVPMVYHKDSEHLRCHYCEAVKEAPAFCPACRSKYIKFFGAGTEKAEAQLRQTFPSARVIRLDQDTAMRKNSGDAIIEKPFAAMITIFSWGHRWWLKAMTSPKFRPSAYWLPTACSTCRPIGRENEPFNCLRRRPDGPDAAPLPVKW